MFEGQNKHYQLLIENGILNSKIESKLKNMPLHLAYKLCEKLLFKKKILDRYNNQCAQLSIESKYKVSDWINKIDLLNIKKVQQEIEHNVKLYKTEKRNGSQHEKKWAIGKLKENASKHSSHKKKKSKWIKIISTSMYS